MSKAKSIVRIPEELVLWKVEGEEAAPCDPQEWVFYLTRIVDLAVSLLAGLCEEHGPDRAFSPESPELLLVRDLLGLVREAGGSVGLDALRLRLLSRLAEDLGAAELTTAIGDLSLWIADPLEVRP